MPQSEQSLDRVQTNLLKSRTPDRTVVQPVRSESPVPAHQPLGNQAAQRFAQSCPLRLPSPAVCRFGGACHACPVSVQAKLQINEPGDKYEQEAERVADAVMRMPEPRVQRQAEPKDEEEEESIQTKPFSEQITPLVQRQAEPKEEEEQEELIQARLIEGAWVQRHEAEREAEEGEAVQTKRGGGQIPQVDSSLTAQICSLGGGGSPLPRAVRGFFEPRFRRDFGDVRVHADGRAAEAAQMLNARAFTVGQDVVFGAGQYAPETAEGNRLLAHELTHVVQQRRCRTPRVQADKDDEPPKKAEEKPPTIEYHVVTKDPDLKVAGVPTHDSLEAFKKALMKARKKDSSQWTLQLEMHGWGNYLAYSTTCKPGDAMNPCLTKDDLKAVFLDDDKWVKWRDKYGPWRMIQLSCQLTEEMARAAEAVFLRPGAPSTAAGRARECETEIEPIEVTVEIGDKPKHIKGHKQYSKLGTGDKKAFIEQLRVLRGSGYCAVDTTNMSDEELLHYYFNEKPKGIWLVCTVSMVVGGVEGFRVPLFKHKKGGVYHGRCHHPAML